MVEWLKQWNYGPMDISFFPLRPQGSNFSNKKQFRKLEERFLQVSLKVDKELVRSR